MAKKNSRKNVVRDEKALDAAAIAEAMNNGGFHGGEESHIVTAPITIDVMDEDIASLFTDDILTLVGPADAAHAKKSEGIGLKSEAKEVMSKRAELLADADKTRKEWNYLNDKLVITRKQVLESLFGAEGGKVSKAADALKNNPKYEEFIRNVYARVELILNRDFTKLVKDTEDARVWLGELEAEAEKLLRKANELGAAGNALIDAANAELKALGFEVKPFVKGVKAH